MIYLDGITPLKEDADKWAVYQELPEIQRHELGKVAKELERKIPRLTIAQAFELTYELVKLYERKG